ncbi:8346_t:CDS:2 [Ambispora leptoticha]|uniref:8346_t:CDS:1 n=1 Tax=Ambispora leptoticha TaxID=144679 RepID=A0A9N9C9J2_9GLOM|nr:8346_t:CDS:2 [Ambispora leptoticha]
MDDLVNGGEINQELVEEVEGASFPLIPRETNSNSGFSKDERKKAISIFLDRIESISYNRDTKKLTIFPDDDEEISNNVFWYNMYGRFDEKLANDRNRSRAYMEELLEDDTYQYDARLQSHLSHFLVMVEGNNNTIDTTNIDTPTINTIINPTTTNTTNTIATITPTPTPTITTTLTSTTTPGIKRKIELEESGHRAAQVARDKISRHFETRSRKSKK